MNHPFIEVFCEGCQDDMYLTDNQPYLDYWTFKCNGCGNIVSVKINQYEKMVILK